MQEIQLVDDSDLLFQLEACRNALRTWKTGKEKNHCEIKRKIPQQQACSKGGKDFYVTTMLLTYN